MTKKPIKFKPSNPLLARFQLCWRATGGDIKLDHEHKFHPTRKWRFDFAEPVTRVAIEIEGGVWSGGRHTRGAGYIGDCEKYNTAAELGWVVFRLPGPMITGANVQRIADYIEFRNRQQHASDKRVMVFSPCGRFVRELTA